MLSREFIIRCGMSDAFPYPDEAVSFPVNLIFAVYDGSTEANDHIVNMLPWIKILNGKILFLYHFIIKYNPRIVVSK